MTAPPGGEQPIVLPAGMTPRLLIFVVAELQAVVRCTAASRAPTRAASVIDDVVVPGSTELDDREYEEDEERQDERELDERLSTLSSKSAVTFLSPPFVSL